MIQKRIAFLPLLIIAVSLKAQSYDIIPGPVSFVPGKGVFELSVKTYLKREGNGLENSVSFLNGYLQRLYGFQLAGKTSKNGNTIVLNFDRLNKPVKGAYRLEVKTKEIHIGGDNEEGVFYAIQTLIQLLPAQPSAVLKIQQLTIEDYPRLAYRGLHLDAGRHFFSVDAVKQCIDFIALHKMNYFHWHLTEDQGWRIEIKKYPLLTQTGSCRDQPIVEPEGRKKLS